MQIRKVLLIFALFALGVGLTYLVSRISVPSSQFFSIKEIDKTIKIVLLIGLKILLYMMIWVNDLIVIKIIIKSINIPEKNKNWWNNRKVFTFNGIIKM